MKLLKNTPNIYLTCKETEINGYFCYTFMIGETTHYIFGDTKEQALNWMLDYIKTYNNGESKQWEQSPIREAQEREL